ncbi:transposase [Myxococcota bacterium]|nr:transposase [Myxococcota bacterium]
MATKRVPSVSSEFEGLDLGDKRLNVRGASMAEAITREPALSLPKIFGDGAELEGAYRFLGNEAVEFSSGTRQSSSTI